jgi:hypothetical protein
MGAKGDNMNVMLIVNARCYVFKAALKMLLDMEE